MTIGYTVPSLDPAALPGARLARQILYIYICWPWLSWPLSRAKTGRIRGHLLAAASVSQVITNITVWIVGILRGLATCS